MIDVVLLRGANVGNKRFSPKAVEAQLKDLQLTSIGAAGTFVLGASAAETTLRERFAAVMPFAPELLLFSAAEVAALVRAGAGLSVPPGARAFATGMDGSGSTVTLPLEVPAGSGWGVRVVGRSGRFLLGVRRRVDATGIYPNEVVERALGVRATTRDWTTIQKVAALLR